MTQMTQTSTAWLSVTDLVNERWSKRFPLHASANSACDELLCSDAISIQPQQLQDPAFDAANFVLETALAHTDRYCKQKQVTISAFHSVEVLRFVQPTNGTLSFLFLMQPAANA